MKKVLVALLVLSAFFYGVLVGAYQIFPYDILKAGRQYVAGAGGAGQGDGRGDGYAAGYSDLSGKTEIPCSNIDLENAMVVLAFGQSNSANYGETRYVPKRSVFNVYAGKCYIAADPMLGASHSGGSAWSRLGDLVVEDGLATNVIFVTIGVGASAIARWAPDGDLFQRIGEAKAWLDGANIRITHLFWHQGEIDGRLGTSKSAYKSMFADMLGGIRGLGIDAPFYMAIASRCEGPVIRDIHEAQLELIAERGDVFKGANTDIISDMDDRHDFCHFSDLGLKKHARAWLQALQ